MGVAETASDNVSRTNSKRSDFFTTLAPGIQAQLPMDDIRLSRTIGQTFSFITELPSNNVQDQTASGLLPFNLASGSEAWTFKANINWAMIPRGTAVDLQNLEMNKWTTNGFTGNCPISGRGNIRMVDSPRRHFDGTYLNNNQGIIRDRLSNYTGLRFSGHAFPNTSTLLDLGATQEIYDQ